MKLHTPRYTYTPHSYYLFYKVPCGINVCFSPRNQGLEDLQRPLPDEEGLLAVVGGRQRVVGGRRRGLRRGRAQLHGLPQGRVQLQEWAVHRRGEQVTVEVICFHVLFCCFTLLCFSWIAFEPFRSHLYACQTGKDWILFSLGEFCSFCPVLFKPCLFSCMLAKIRLRTLSSY